MEAHWENSKDNSNNIRQYQFVITEEDELTGEKIIERITLFDLRKNQNFRSRKTEYEFWALHDTLPHTHIVTPEYVSEDLHIWGDEIVMPPMSLEETKEYVVNRLIDGYGEKIQNLVHVSEKIDEKIQRAMEKENFLIEYVHREGEKS